MAEHVHFDRAAALRAFDEAQAVVNAAIDAKDTTPAAKAIEKGIAPIHRELVGFIVDCRNGEFPHEQVAQAIGGALAQFAFTVIQNYPCPCVQARIIDSFSLHLAAMAGQDPSVLVKGAFRSVGPMQGGRA